MILNSLINNKLICFQKDTIATGYSYFWGKYGGKYPLYTANMSSVYDTNHSHGEFYVNFEKSKISLNMNLSEGKLLHLVICN